MNWKLRVLLIVGSMIWIFSSHIFMGIVSALSNWDIALEIWSANRSLFRLIFNPGWGFTILFASACCFGAEDREKEEIC